MRKLMTVLTMILVLLSSGAAQMAYHICDEDGVHIWVDDCHPETSETQHQSSSCCSESKSAASVKDACCQEAYFFSLSPLPVSLVKFKLEKTIQWHCRAWNQFEYQFQLPNASSLACCDVFLQTVIKPPNHPSQSGLCIWII